MNAKIIGPTLLWSCLDLVDGVEWLCEIITMKARSKVCKSKSELRRGKKQNPGTGFRNLWIVILFISLAGSVFVVTYWRKFPSILTPNDNPLFVSAAPKKLEELLELQPSQLEKYDIALLNLLCSQGLPGTEEMKIGNCLDALDKWAGHVQAETARNFHRYRDNPADFYNSEGYFRMLMMAVVVYEDYGIRYNPDRITLPGKIDPNDRFFANSQDIFLNGLIEGQRMGTCSSMPVLYIAIGRRLGYPLKLVATKAHLFIRWESNVDYFDVEATGKGMNRYDDEHFKQWPFPVTDAEIRTEGFLKSLTASEELAVFLSLRGNCLKETGRLKEAAECYAKASRLAPTWNAYRALLADTEASSPSSFSSAKHIVTPQSRGMADLELPGQTVVGPDPNPLKQMNGQ